MKVNANIFWWQESTRKRISWVCCHRKTIVNKIKQKQSELDKNILENIYCG